MSSREQVALEPSLAAVLAQDFHDAPVSGNVIVDVEDRSAEAAVLDLEDGTEPVRVGLVGAEQAEVLLAGIASEYVAQEHPQPPRRFVVLGRRSRHG